MSTTYGTPIQTDEHRIPERAPEPTPPAPRHRLRRTLSILRTVIVVLILVAAAVGGGYYVVSHRLADRAFVNAGTAVLTAEPIAVGSADAAVVTRMLTSERKSVTTGAVLATITVTADGSKPKVQELQAPAAGVVTEINVAPGQIARAGEPIITLYDPEKLVFQVDVPLETLRKLRLGMTAYVTGPGLTGRIATTLQQVQPKVAAGQPAATSDGLTVVLVPDPAVRSTVRTLVPGLQFGVVVDTTTAVGSTPAVNSA
jgi:multidrug resistance efflux pump